MGGIHSVRHDAIREVEKTIQHLRGIVNDPYFPSADDMNIIESTVKRCHEIELRLEKLRRLHNAQ